MQVIHTIGGLAVDLGGPSVTVPAICEHLRRLHETWKIVIVAGADARGAPNRLPASVPVIEVSSGQYLRTLRRVADSEAQLTSLVHDHGQWLPINHASAVLARQRRLPRIVSPRGMLSPWTRNHRGWKKRAAWWLYAHRDITQTQVVHATSELEARELRALGITQPIALIPNGVELARTLPAASSPPQRPYLLFLGRVHRKKGIRELLRVWQSLEPGEWELVIAGPDEERILSRSSLPGQVRYVGRVEGEAKHQLMQQASLFVLPSYSENFGVAVAESLIAGVPVIATHGTPWQQLAAHNCGWWIPMNEDCLRETLGAAMATPQDQLRAMGRRGRDFATRSFSWPRIAEQMAHVYLWMVGSGPQPMCVQTE